MVSQLSLFFVRCLVFTCVIMVILYCVNPDLEQWGNRLYEEYLQFSATMKDHEHDVPIADRRPKETIKAFYTNTTRTERIQNYQQKVWTDHNRNTINNTPSDKH